MVGAVVVAALGLLSWCCLTMGIVLAGKIAS